MEQQNEMPNEQVNVKKIADEFSSWPVSAHQLQHINDVRAGFDQLQDHICNIIAPHNARYLSIVKTKLEEACMFAVKGISKP